MGRLDPKYSREQKKAVNHLINDLGLSAVAACARAREGIGDLEPFDMNVETAGREARRARDGSAENAARGDRWARIAEQDDANLITTEVLWVCLDALMDQAQAIEQQAVEEQNLAKLGQVVKLAMEVRGVLVGAKRDVPPELPPEPSPAENSVASLTAALQERAQQRDAA